MAGKLPWRRLARTVRGMPNQTETVPGVSEGHERAEDRLNDPVHESTEPSWWYRIGLPTLFCVLWVLAYFIATQTA